MLDDGIHFVDETNHLANMERADERSPKEKFLHRVVVGESIGDFEVFIAELKSVVVQFLGEGPVVLYSIGHSVTCLQLLRRFVERNSYAFG